MTDKEKAKAYDEALELARKLNKETWLSQELKDSLKQAFPELAESDDEKNIKDLIDELKCSLRAANCQNEACNGGHEKRIALLEWALAWLEKQGDHANFRDKIQVGDKVTRNKDGVLVNLSQLERVAKPKQKPYGEREECKDCQANYAGECKGFCTMKKNEQKPTDTVKPKFKVGDWVVQGCNIVKIRCVGDKYYCYETVGGYVDDMLVSEIDSLYHLWTIEDVEDGDVLAEDSCIFIIQKLGDNSTAAKTYCTLYDDGDFGDGAILYFDINSTKPATKKQRDLLFQKMHEAGYIWDSESKQLLSLKAEPSGEQEPVFEMKTPEESLDISSAEYNKIVDECIFDEQKPKWSEEDDKKQQSLIKGLEDQLGFGWASDPFSREEYINWLKSLKKRNTY